MKVAFRLLPSGIRGRSLVGQFDSRDDTSACPAKPLIAESPAYGPDSQSISFRGWKLIRRGDGSELLFDLAKDSDEAFNVISESTSELKAGLRLNDRSLNLQPLGVELEFALGQFHSQCLQPRTIRAELGDVRGRQRRLHQGQYLSGFDLAANPREFPVRWWQ